MGLFLVEFARLGFDRDIWPVVFIELEGGGKGHVLAREAVFWSTAAVYLLLLATIVFAK